jgi:hypothetical protein
VIIASSHLKQNFVFHIYGQNSVKQLFLPSFSSGLSRVFEHETDGNEVLKVMEK